MAYLAPRAKRARDELAADNDAAANASAQGHEHKAADALGRALPELAEGGSIGVVHEGEPRCGERLQKGRSQTIRIQLYVGKEAHATLVVHRPRHVEAQRNDVRPRVPRARDQGGETIGDLLVGSVTHDLAGGYLGHVQDLTPHRHQARLDGGPAHIYAKHTPVLTSHAPTPFVCDHEGLSRPIPAPCPHDKYRLNAHVCLPHIDRRTPNGPYRLDCSNVGRRHIPIRPFGALTEARNHGQEYRGNPPRHARPKREGRR